MIVGIVALITALFFGGSTNDYFLVEDIDKAANTYVVEKSRLKTIKASLKKGKKSADALYKERAKNGKAIVKGLLNYETSKEDFDKYLDIQLESVKKHQELVFNTRLEVMNEIEPDEWEKIVDYSKERHAKLIAKAKKKAAKKGDPWEEVQSTIDKVVTSEKEHNAVTQELVLLKRQFDKITTEIMNRNVANNEIIQTYSSSYDDLNSIGENLNELRVDSYNALVLFRAQIKNRTTESEYKAVMKSVCKNIL